ncbi:MAG: PfkB family carbohydrate kinase [Burkholderiaceae bacterium]
MSPFFACVGHASVDHHFEVDDFAVTPTKTPASSYGMIAGGMAANAAMALARLGAPVRLLGRVGDDAAGAFVRDAVLRCAVDAHLEVVPNSYTSVSSVIVDRRGERQIYNHRGDALAKAHALDVRQLQGAQAVLVDPRWVQGALAALQWAHTQGLLGVLDADIAPHADLQSLVPAAHWAVFSESGLACYAPGARQQDALASALAAGAQVAMVTLGERGVAWMHAAGGGLHTVPAFAVQAQDTTGAGDVFHAALTLALCEGMGELAAIRFASAAAALKCTQRHGVLGTPGRDQVEQFLLQNR